MEFSKGIAQYCKHMSYRTEHFQLVHGIILLTVFVHIHWIRPCWFGLRVWVNLSWTQLPGVLLLLPLSLLCLRTASGESMCVGEGESMCVGEGCNNTK